MRFRLFILFAACTCAAGIEAGSLTVTVKDVKGALVSDAVVYARSAGATTARTKKQAIIDQQNKEFVPYVTAVQVGTAILFPNKDNIRHHVYSFSPAKKFELPLYAGVPAEPVLFDKEGFVTLGCNIHDWMIAYVAVLPTPHFQVTGNEGRVTLKNLSAGQYTVEVWHPALKSAPEKFEQHVDLGGDGTKDVLFTVELKSDFRAKRAPPVPTGGYH